MRNRQALTVSCVIAFLLITASGPAATARDIQAMSDQSAVRRVVDDYIDLYRKDSLPRWKTLFLPGFTASYTNDDGSVTTRTLDDFYERQRGAFERGPVSERLENVRIDHVGRLAHVFADFYFTSGGVERHGQLMLQMVEVKREFKIAGLAFTYHLQ